MTTRISKCWTAGIYPFTRQNGVDTDEPKYTREGWVVYWNPESIQKLGVPSEDRGRWEIQVPAFLRFLDRNLPAHQPLAKRRYKHESSAMAAVEREEDVLRHHHVQRLKASASKELTHEIRRQEQDLADYERVMERHRFTPDPVVLETLREKISDLVQRRDALKKQIEAEHTSN